MVPIAIKPPTNNFISSKNLTNVFEKDSNKSLFISPPMEMYSLDQKKDSIDTADSLNNELDAQAKIIQSKQKYGQVVVLIEKFLKEEQITQEEINELSTDMFIIIDGLIRRKLKCSLSCYVKSNTNINYHVLKPKRLEENYKMVFKSAFKVLSSKFRTTLKGKRSKSDEASFYDYYFSNALNNDISLESFFHPNK